MQTLFECLSLGAPEAGLEELCNHAFRKSLCGQSKNLYQVDTTESCYMC